ncbi:MAG: hypothetical protein ACUVXB_16765 [Bryobacteraceae bacterium]|jgi:hypothetical protein|nr:hypothetical protein [Bryobacteraceae bacterium]
MAGYHGGQIVLRYCTMLLIDANWQQLARAVAGIVMCAHCLAPTCER